MFLDMTDSPDFHIHMFEPCAHLADEIRKTIDDPRATLYEEALWNYDGYITIRIPTKDGKTKYNAISSYPRENTKKGKGFTIEKVQVPCRKAQWFINNLSPGPVVLYSNSEGAEYNIVHDLFEKETWKRIKVWAVAVHGPNALDNIDYEYEKLLKTFEDHNIDNIKAQGGKGKAQIAEDFLTKHVLPRL